MPNGIRSPYDGNQYVTPREAPAEGRGQAQESIDVWVMHKLRVVQVSELPGVPEAVIVASDGTVGGTIFPRECWLGPFTSWDKAREVAEAKAKELGYQVEYATLEDLCDEDGDEGVGRCGGVLG